MEEQVLEIFGSIVQTTQDQRVFFASPHILNLGKQRFGPTWGGSLSSRTQAEGFDHAPVVSRFLGRLVRKGLLHRFDSPITPWGDQWTEWELTDDGYQLLGIEKTTATEH